MASTSVSSIQKSFKYDVFLSFRGEDTRKTFVDHLYHALHQKGITTYRDDERIEKGERISDELIRCIEDSKFHIIVFSKNYASSSWCLEELVKIMECQKMTEHTAYPIFYDVEPTEIRNQSGAVGEAFAKHVRGSWSSVLPLDCLYSIVASCCNGYSASVYLEKEEDVGRWRMALKEAASLAGMELRNTFNGHEATFIQQIVQDISPKLHFMNLCVDRKLVGMETRVKNVVSSLETGFDDIRMVGIKGMGGGGKTTLARAVFNHISTLFEGKSFVENVREVSKGSLYGLKELQKKILSDVLNDQSIVEKGTSNLENMMKTMMRSRKVLVVLDDADDVEQLEALAGELTWFKPGSRIIITTRDQQVLVAHEVKCIHDVNLLSHEEAICLFSRYAFKTEIPKQGYENLSKKVVRYADGLPLTIKVLGSHLCGRNELEWVDAIERLKTIPLDKTLKRLELSYNGLENDQKEIFLDVICILKGEEKDISIRILESCGFNAQIGLRVLEQKSLITISHTYCVRFHDHIEEMGWNIVRRMNPDEPSRHSRLWIKEEIEDILINESGTEATRSIKLMYLDLHPTIIMKGLRKMKELRLLYVVLRNAHCKVEEASKYLPDALRYLYWHWYPFQSLPKTFQGSKLVNLKMDFSNITELWEGGERKVLKKLRFLDLRYSKLRKFDLGMTPHLEILDLRSCDDFVELHMPVNCPKLKYLNLNGSKLSNINLAMISNIEDLYLENCNDFVELHVPVECPKLKCLKFKYSKVENLYLGMIPNIETLDLGGCKNFVELHMPFVYSKLKFLTLAHSKIRSLNLGLIPNIETLDLGGYENFGELLMPIECPKLRFLKVTGSKIRSLNLGLIPNIEILDLRGCEYFVELHMPIECPKLKFLQVTRSKIRSVNLGLTPNLERLDLGGCYCLQEIHAPVGCLKKLIYLYLSGCSRFKDFLVDKDVGCNFFIRDSTAKLELTAKSVNVCPLHPNNNLPKFQFKCFYDEAPSSSSGNLEKLISFGLCACTNLESFSASICGLQRLSYLKLEGSIPEVPKDLWQLENLKELSLLMREIKHLPDSICMLKHLKSLELESCLLLEKLPDDLGRLQCLEKLHLMDCISLRGIPNSICNMKCLKRFRLTHCRQVEKLPEEIGSLECLEELDLADCISLRDIPNNVCMLKSLIYLFLRFCIRVKKLPKELGRLKCLKELNIDGSGISHLPQSIYQLKSLCIYGSRGQLMSYGFTSSTMTSRYRASYYVEL